MTAENLFSIFNMTALMGWALLGVGILLRNAFLRDKIAGLWLPVALSAAYAVLILFFFTDAPGGFGSLADVQLLFTSPWAALAGWVHYLAFDLFIGAYIAHQAAEREMARWPLAIILPLTFLFGPAGLLTFETWKAIHNGGKA